MNNCKNCADELGEKFCSNCGRPVELKRIDGQFILEEIGSVLNFEKGILFTTKELLTKPRESIRGFIADDRNRLVKPIIFIIVSSLIYTIIARQLLDEDGYIQFESETQTATKSVFRWIQGNYGYANIIMGVFVSIWIKILFRKHGYNLFEIQILLCFVMGIGMLIFSVFGFFEGLTGVKLMQVAGMVGIAYISWAIGQCFGPKNKINYFKAFLGYLLGMMSFIFSAFVVGYLADLM